MIGRTGNGIFTHSRFAPRLLPFCKISDTYYRQKKPITNHFLSCALTLSFLLLSLHALLPKVSYAEEPPRRIISLAPNMTEILFALGLDDRIVGVTNFCDYPPDAKKKQKVGGMSNPSLETVISLKPDIVVMTTDGNPKDFEQRLQSLKIRTYVATMRRLAELPDGIRDLGKKLGVEGRAERLAESLQLQIHGYKRSSDGKAVRVLVIVWPEPLIGAGSGTVIDDAITLLGAENVGGGTAVSYPKYSSELILSNPPDVIIIGKGMERGDVKKISAGLLTKLKTLPAIKDGKVFFVGDDLYRLGPRTVRGIEELGRVLGR